MELFVGPSIIDSKPPNETFKMLFAKPKRFVPVIVTVERVDVQK